MGTTGAAMLLIRPCSAPTRTGKHSAHVVVFFIFLVANIGGALTPLGDPPLFLGFLKGVDFFWTTRRSWPNAVRRALLLADLLRARQLLLSSRAKSASAHDPTPDRALGIEGKVNFAAAGRA